MANNEKKQFLFISLFLWFNRYGAIKVGKN